MKIPEWKDPVLDYLVKNRLPLTVANYLAIAYMGDVSSVDELGPEDAADVQELIDEGILQTDVASNFRN